MPSGGYNEMRLVAGCSRQGCQKTIEKRNLEAVACAYQLAHTVKYVPNMNRDVMVLTSNSGSPPPTAK